MAAMTVISNVSNCPGSRIARDDVQTCKCQPARRWLMIRDDERQERMTIFLMILVANSVTLLITVIAAIRSHSWSYRLLVAASLVSTLFALRQFVTARYHLATLIVSALLLGLLTLRGQPIGGNPA